MSTGLEVEATLLLVGRLCLGVFLAPSAIAKLTHLKRFAQDLIAYEILPAGVARIAAFILPWVELGLAVSLILGIALPATAMTTAFVFAAFSAAVVVNLRRGREISCGCYGIAGTETISWGIVARNCMLLIMSAGVATFSGALAGSTGWLPPALRGEATDSTSLALLLALIGCAIVLIYLVEWSVNAQAGVSRLKNMVARGAETGTVKPRLMSSDHPSGIWTTGQAPNGHHNEPGWPRERFLKDRRLA